MQERRKENLMIKKAYTTIIVGIITVLIFIGGGLIGIVTWKDSQEYNIQTLVKKDIIQDNRLNMLENMMNKNNIQLGKINTGIEFIKEVITNAK